MFIHDPALVAAVAETIRDPRKFKSLLDHAAYLAGGRVEGFAAAAHREPVTVQSARYCHPDDNITVAWDVEATLSFRTRIPAEQTKP